MQATLTAVAEQNACGRNKERETNFSAVARTPVNFEIQQQMKRPSLVPMAKHRKIQPMSKNISK